jgi:hypothetical protein
MEVAEELLKRILSEDVWSKAGGTVPRIPYASLRIRLLPNALKFWGAAIFTCTVVTSKEGNAVEVNENNYLPEDQLPGLDIAMPYLASTYDERMFERLRTHAQFFDILTGGDPTAGQESGSFWLDPDSEGEHDGTSSSPCRGRCSTI